ANRVTVTVSPGCSGAAGRYLGMLATLLGQFDDAAGHFDAALAMNERLGAPGLLAHTQLDYARMLIARGGAGDRERAASLLDAALATARGLGFTRLAEDTRVLAADV